MSDVPVTPTSFSPEPTATAKPKRDGAPRRPENHNATQARLARSNRGGTSLLAYGENMVWVTGGSLAICVVMIVGLLALVVYQGIGTFWPKPLVTVELLGGGVRMGEVTRRESFTIDRAYVEALPEAQQDTARRLLDSDGRGEANRRLFRTGNFDLTNTHFHWVNNFAVAGETTTDDAVVVERRAWGRFYGYPKAFLIDGSPVARSPGEIWEYFERYHRGVNERYRRRYKLQKYDFGRLHSRVENARLELKSVESEYGEDAPEYSEAKRSFDVEIAAIEHQNRELTRDIELLDAENARYEITMTTADGLEATLALADIVRAYPANRISAGQKAGIYLSRWWEFLTADPREANSEGGVWPAIVGTVIMTLLMSVAVVPFGVLAALYLREYAKAGALVSAVRIAVNNLAGVPSIVFGVFGLGFFCYMVGASIDELLFSAKLPNPTYGKGGVLWASLTLALLTLPVVVVATEEALAAVPGSMREGSYACGASKWQTIRRIVLPRAMPGIMTGFILAMARGAGEVAPLMLVGAVKLAPDLPIDNVFPYLHPERSFMHLGFHIYDVGFQSQNSEAAKPMVYTTTLLLISIVAVLNLSSIWIRTRLRRKFIGSKF
jgi:phosphate transport system permease protein